MLQFDQPTCPLVHLEPDESDGKGEIILSVENLRGWVRLTNEEASDLGAKLRELAWALRELSKPPVEPTG